MVKARILVAEDEGVSARLTEMMLKSLGYAPVVISSGEEAIKKAGEVNPDLVLMDILLKGSMDGVQAAEEINTRFNIPVVYLTAYAENDLLQRAKIAEPYGYIVKPFKKTELHSTIDMALHKHKIDMKLKDREQALEKLAAELKAKNEQLQRDITARKRVEEALRASEEKFHNLVESVPIGIIISTPDGRIIEANKAVVQMHHYGSKEEFMKRPAMTRYYEPADRERFVSLAAKGPVNDFEVRRKRHDGTSFWASQSSIPQTTESGERVFITVVRDITERKRAEEALKASEEKFHNLVESVPVGISITSIDGHLIEANKALVQMHHYDSKEEFMETPAITRYYNPDDRERFLSIMAKGRVNDFEVRLKRRDGTIFYGSFSSIPQTTESGERVFITVVQDITERKQAEEALIESEARYRALVDLGTQVGEAVVMLQDEGGKEGVHVFCSDAWLQMTDYSREELCNMTMGELLCPRDRKAALRRHRRRMRGERIAGLFELTIIRKDGTEVPLEVTSAYTTYLGKDANVLYVRDLTKRKQVLEALRQSEEKLRLMFEAIPDGITVIDTKGKIVDANKAAAHIHGYDNKEEMIGLNRLELLDKQDHPRIREVRKKTLKEGYLGAPIEVTDLRRDRSKFPVEVSGSVLRDNGGNPTGLITITKDLTKRKQVLEALRQSEEKLRLMFEAIPDGITVIDTKGKIVQVNQAAAHIHGYDDKEEMIGLEVLELLDKQEYPRIREVMKKTLREGYLGAPIEVTDLRKDRSKFPVEVSGGVLRDNGGNPTGLITITKDITERKQAQQVQERFSRQLQEKVNELEALSYGIAHDLRSPLLSIEGFSHLLHDDIKNKKMENVQEDIRLLETGVRKMQQFLNRTLEYSRAGQLVKPNKDISFSKIVKDVVKESIEQLYSIGATISIAERFPRVCVDDTRIRQVLTNLIQNSIKYRSKTRPLKIEIGYWMSGDEIVFFVRDNGTGIGDSEAEKIFDLFYRGTTDIEGSGAGLAIVKKIIEAHGGKIWVQAQQEEGTTMCFTLPEQSGVSKEDNNGKN